jgi:hypothetical protein
VSRGQGHHRALVKRSRQAGRTAEPIIRGVLGIVDRRLREAYGANYSDRCLQASLAVRDALDELGLTARVCCGEVCLCQGYAGRSDEIAWEGFWGQNLHYWVWTQFDELVDLTISQLCLHPTSLRPDGFVIPPIWWQTLEALPPTLHYIGQGMVSTCNLPPSEAAELAELASQVRRDIHEPAFRRGNTALGPVLTGPDSWARLADQHHPWVTVNNRAARQNVRPPKWVMRRVTEWQMNAATRR